MKTPQEKYYGDPEYKYIVDVFLSLIREARFTPSELREACILDCIKYQEQNINRRALFITAKAESALNILEAFKNTEG